MLNSCATSKLIGILILLMVTSFAVADDDGDEWKEEGNSKATKLESCVAPTSEMRRNHMSMIKHQRDITVHEGIRKTDNSLSGCIDCHVNYDESGHAIPVNAEDQFCESCHEYVAASLDCFSCHSTVPK